MSDVDTRTSHSKRLHSKKVKSKRQAAIARMAGLKVDSEHRFHKRHALNCGVPECVACGNPRKVFGEETIQERRAKQAKLHESGQDGNAVDC